MFSSRTEQSTLKIAARDLAHVKPPNRVCFSRSREKFPNVINPNKIGPYQLRETLGRGSFSIVKLAIDENTGKRYACKIVPKKRLIEQNMEAQFEHEVRILQKLKHPHIATLEDILKDTLNYYLILELCSTGSLYDYIVNHKRISEQDAKYLFKQIAKTLEYLHTNNVTHRDIKPENILIDKNLTVKFIDFGFSEIQPNNSLLETQCGSFSYVSPQCLKGDKYDGFENDIWSAGVVLYTMVNGQLPWSGSNIKQLRNQIIHADYYLSAHFSEELQDLIKGMLQPDTEKRYRIDTIVNHPWLENVGDPALSHDADLTILQAIGEDAVDKFFSANLNYSYQQNHSEVLSECQALLIMTNRRRFSIPRKSTSCRLERAMIKQARSYSFDPS